jgi:hypothetical protein
MRHKLKRLSLNNQLIGARRYGHWPFRERFRFGLQCHRCAAEMISTGGNRMKKMIALFSIVVVFTLSGMAQRDGGIQIAPQTWATPTGKTRVRHQRTECQYRWVESYSNLYGSQVRSKEMWATCVAPTTHAQ